MNINDYVSVKLTPDGEEILKTKRYSSYIFNYDKETKILNIELWELMGTYGEYMYMGCQKQVFVKNEITVIE